MPCVYVLYSKKTGRYYTGSTREDTAEARLTAHNYGKTQSTKSGRPWEVVYNEELPNYTDARKREIFLKSGVGRKWVSEKLENL